METRHFLDKYESEKRELGDGGDPGLDTEPAECERLGMEDHKADEVDAEDDANADTDADEGICIDRRGRLWARRGEKCSDLIRESLTMTTSSSELSSITIARCLPLPNGLTGLGGGGAGWKRGLTPK